MQQKIDKDIREGHSEQVTLRDKEQAKDPTLYSTLNKELLFLVSVAVLVFACLVSSAVVNGSSLRGGRRQTDLLHTVFPLSGGGC